MEDPNVTAQVAFQVKGGPIAGRFTKFFVESVQIKFSRTPDGWTPVRAALAGPRVSPHGKPVKNTESKDDVDLTVSRSRETEWLWGLVDKAHDKLPL